MNRGPTCSQPSYDGTVPGRASLVPSKRRKARIVFRALFLQRSRKWFRRRISRCRSRFLPAGANDFQVGLSCQVRVVTAWATSVVLEMEPIGPSQLAEQGAVWSDHGVPCSGQIPFADPDPVFFGPFMARAVDWAGNEDQNDEVVSVPDLCLRNEGGCSLSSEERNTPVSTPLLVMAAMVVHQVRARRAKR